MPSINKATYTIFLLVCLAFTNPAYSQVIKSFQKISSTQGGFTEAGGLLENFDDFGEQMDNIGDLDGDGVIDLIVGVKRDDDGNNDAGCVYILFMNTNGTVKSLQKISATQGGFVGTINNGDNFGTGATGLGDVDGDGVPDVAVGSWQEDDGGTNTGAVYILFLNTDGTVKSQQKISRTQGGFTGFIGNFHRFGGDLAELGDLDNDGVPDLFVTGGNGFWIVYLNSDGTVKRNDRVTQSNSGGFGATGALIGDLDNDGVMDIATGAQFDDESGVNAGAAWILFMNANGSVRSRQKINTVQGGFTGQLEPDDEFGQSVSPAGDLDGDGVPDLIVGAEHADEPAQNGNRVNTGEVWILYLNTDGTVKGHDLITSEVENFPRIRPHANIGQSVTMLGDLDGDGITDIGFGADGDRDGGVDRGAVYVVFLQDRNSSGTDGRFAQSANSQNLLVMEAENFTNKTSQGIHNWEFFSAGAASGAAAMEALPDNGTSVPTDYASNSPRLDFDVTFATTGTHYVWVRAFGKNNGADSVHVGLDGADLTSSRRFDDFALQSWDWSGDIQTAPGVLQRGVIQINSAGDHTLNIWMREDGIRVDKLLLTTDPNFVPTGNGPAESPRIGGTNNNPPSITNPGDQNNIENDSVNLPIQASDVDPGDVLTFSATGLPTGLSINTNTGVITGTASTAGTFNTSVTVSDGNVGGTANAPFTWTVNSNNNPPNITNPGNQSNVQNDSVSLPIQASDVDPGDVLTYSATGLPTGLSINSNTGVITGTANTVGTFNTSVTVSDGNVGGTANAAFTWTITMNGGGNNPPSITNPGNQSNIENDSVNLPIQASDVDPGDVLTFSATGLPTGLSINTNTGVITGTASTVGTFNTSVTVSDGNVGGTANAAFTWTVSTNGGGGSGFQQSTASGNLLVMEVENFDGNVQQGTDSWTPFNNNGASGGSSMRPLPDNGDINATNYASDSPRLDYNVTFVTTGTHYVWLRGFSRNTGADSVHVGLDGMDLLSSRRLDDFALQTWDWSGDVQVSPGVLQRATIEVTSPGSHTLNIWMREDGFRADKLLLTTDPNFVPTGNGPNESPQGGGGNAAPVLANISDQTVTVGDLLTIPLSASDIDGPGPLELTVTNDPAGSNFTDSGNGIGEFSWTPQASDLANSPFEVTFTVTDAGNNLFDEQTVSIDVRPIGATGFLQSSSSGNLLVMEVENFDSNIAQGNDNWTVFNNNGASGGSSMRPIPDNGDLVATGYVTTSPRLDYEVTFVTTGTHYVWVRGFGRNTGADSVHIGLDNVDLTSSRRLDDFTLQTWDWSGDIQIAPGTLTRATINVTATGSHTINMWMREDGFRADKILLTTDPNFVPNGTGPAESPRN